MGPMGARLLAEDQDGEYRSVRGGGPARSSHRLRAVHQPLQDVQLLRHLRDLCGALGNVHLPVHARLPAAQHTSAGTLRLHACMRM